MDEQHGWWPEDPAQLWPFLRFQGDYTNPDPAKRTKLWLFTREQYEQLYPLLRRTVVPIEVEPAAPLQKLFLNSMGLRCVLNRPRGHAPDGMLFEINTHLLKTRLGFDASLANGSLAGNRGPPFNTKWSIKNNSDTIKVRLNGTQTLAPLKHSEYADPALVAPGTRMGEPVSIVAGDDDDDAMDVVESDDDDGDQKRVEPTIDACQLGLLFTLEWLLTLIYTAQSTRNQFFEIECLDAVSISGRHTLPFELRTYGIRGIVHPQEVSQASPSSDDDGFFDVLTGGVLTLDSMARKVSQISYRPPETLLAENKQRLYVFRNGDDCRLNYTLSFEIVWFAASHAELLHVHNTLKDNPPSWLLCTGEQLERPDPRHAPAATLNKVMVSIGEREHNRTLSTMCTRSWWQIATTFLRTYMVTSSAFYVRRLLHQLVRALRTHVIAQIPHADSEFGLYVQGLPFRLQQYLRGTFEDTWRNKVVLELDNVWMQRERAIDLQMRTLDAIFTALRHCETHTLERHTCDLKVWENCEAYHLKLRIEHAKSNGNGTAKKKQASNRGGGNKKRAKKAAASSLAFNTPALQWKRATKAPNSDDGEEDDDNNNNNNNIAQTTLTKGCFLRLLLMHVPHHVPLSESADVYFEQVLTSEQLWDYVQFRPI